MTRRIFLSALAGLILSLGFAPTLHARELAKPDYIVTYFYADWCPGCKILSPKLDQVRAENNLDKENILFIKLDLTDKPRINQSILLAQALGLGDFLKAQGSATGYVVILDAKSMQEQARFNAGASIEELTEALKTLANL